MLVVIPLMVLTAMTLNCHLQKFTIQIKGNNPYKKSFVLFNRALQFQRTKNSTMSMQSYKQLGYVSCRS